MRSPVIKITGWRSLLDIKITVWFVFIAIVSKWKAVESYNASYSSHKTDALSHIPWNILLDPSYTSHKMAAAAASNHAVYTPPHYGQPSAMNYDRNPSSTIPSTSSQIHYVPPPPSYSSSTLPTASQQVVKSKYSIPIPNHSDDYSHNSNMQNGHSQITYGHYGSQASSASHHPLHGSSNSLQNSNGVDFPGSIGIGGYPQGLNGASSFDFAPASSQKKNVPSKKKPEGSNKQKKRKPSDYMDFEEEDYFGDQDNSYHDYDYARRPQGSSRDPPNRFNFSPSSATSSNGDPYGLLPSGSDPDGFFTKAKDLLRGGNHGRPSYSSGNSDSYYSDYNSPSKYYQDYDPYGSSKYYAPGAETAMKYPKGEYHGGAHDFEYDYGGGHGNKYDPPPISYPEKRKGSRYGPLAFALGLLPLGLLLASLVPTVVTIPVTTAVATGRRRRRSVQFVNPVLDTITKYGVTSLEDPMCLQRVFCNVVTEGKQKRSSIIQKLYYRAANLLDEKWAESIGLKMLLRAVLRD